MNSADMPVRCAVRRPLMILSMALFIAPPEAMCAGYFLKLQ